MDRLLARLRSSGHAAIRATHDATLELSDAGSIGRRATCVVGVGTTTVDGSRTGLAGPVRIRIEADGAEAWIDAVANPYHRIGDGAVVRRGGSRLPDTLAVDATATAATLPASLRTALGDPATTVTTEVWWAPIRADRRRTVAVASVSPHRPPGDDVTAWVRAGHPVVAADPAARRVVTGLAGTTTEPGSVDDRAGVVVVVATDAGALRLADVLPGLLADLPDDLPADLPDDAAAVVLEWAGAADLAVAAAVAGPGPLVRAAGAHAREVDDAVRRAGSDGAVLLTVAARDVARTLDRVGAAEGTRRLAAVVGVDRTDARGVIGSDGSIRSAAAAAAPAAEVVLAIGPDGGARSALVAPILGLDPLVVRDLLRAGVPVRTVVDVLSARPGSRRNDVQRWVRSLGAGEDRGAARSRP